MILRIGQIAPDGVAIDIPWEEWEVDGSVFIPCVDTDKAVKELKSTARQKNIKIECRIRIEEYFGIRAWRIA